MGEVRKFTRFSGERVTHSPYVGFPPVGSNVNQPATIGTPVIDSITDTGFVISCLVTPGSSPVTPSLHFGLTTAYAGTAVDATEGEITEATTCHFTVTELSAYTKYYCKVVAGATELAYGSAIQTLLPADKILHITSRSGLSLVDTLDNNASILVPVAKFNGSNQYIERTSAAIVGGSAWDVTVVFRVTTGSANTPLLSCGGYSGGTKGLMLRVNAGGITVSTSNGTSSSVASFAHTITSGALYSLRLQWDGAEGGTMTVTVNGSALTSTTTRGWSSTPGTNLQIARYATVYGNMTLHSLIGSLGGLAVSLYPHGLTTTEYDTNKLLFTWYGDAGGRTVYDASGPTYFLDKGWTTWKDGSNVYQYVPNDSSGRNQIGLKTLLGGTYAKVKDYSGSVDHNTWDSYIRFTDNFFDRSNATIWKDACRSSSYYLAGSVKDFHISELNFKTLQSWLNDGYAGRLYPKFTNNSIDDRTTLKELLLFTGDKKTANQQGVLRYTNDITRCQKDVDGNFILDANNYLVTYLYDDLGVDSLAAANHAAYQAALNSGNLVISSGDSFDVKVISQPLYIQAGRTLTVNCELRIKKGSLVNLTQNVSVNDTVYHVDDTAPFTIGEWVAISDNLLTVQAGSTQTRRVASCGRITDIGAGTITLDLPSKYAITAASGGKLGHLQSVVIADSANGITVNGTGIINANKANQYDVEPVGLPNEEIRCGCGISVYHADNATITGGLTILNAPLHNIAFWGNDGRTNGNDHSVTHVTCDKAHDKNILMVRSKRMLIEDVLLTNAQFEDGVAAYLYNEDWTFRRITTRNNNRTGILALANEVCNGLIEDCNSSRVTINSSGITVNTLALSGDNACLSIDDSYTGGNDLEFNDVTIDRAWSNGLGQISMLGNVANIAFNRLVVSNCITDNSKASINAAANGGATYPDNVTIDGTGITNHTGTKFAIHASADVVITNFAGYP